MDDETRQAFADLMARLNTQTERILDRLTGVEAEVRNLRSEHEVTRKMVTELPATVLGECLESGGSRRFRQGQV